MSRLEKRRADWIVRNLKRELSEDYCLLFQKNDGQERLVVDLQGIVRFKVGPRPGKKLHKLLVKTFWLKLIWNICKKERHFVGSNCLQITVFSCFFPQTNNMACAHTDPKKALTLLCKNSSCINMLHAVTVGVADQQQTRASRDCSFRRDSAEL